MEVNLGSSQLKKNFFPDSFDSSTTLNFGECIPQFCRAVVPNTHASIDIRSGVRLAPLSLPTFGKAFLKSYVFYNRISDIWPPFDNFLTQTPYTGASALGYIPSEVPSVPLSMLWAIVLSNSTVTYYRQTAAIGSTTSKSPVNKTKFQLSVASSGTYDPGADLIFAQRGFGSTSYRDYLLNNSGLNPVFGTNFKVVQDSSSPDFVSPNSADFLVPDLSGSSGLYKFDSSNGKYVPNPRTAGTIYCMAVRLNDSGKLLRKIFLGLGYKIGNYRKRVSILPLFAFYYNYFDTFAPKRFLQLIDTPAYKLMNLCTLSGEPFSTVVYNYGFENELTNSTTGMPTNLMNEFINDLCSCYYTEDTDYYTSQIIGEINNFGGNINYRVMGASRTEGVQLQGISNYTPDAAPGVDLSGNVLHTEAQQNVLSRLTEFLNIRSLSGGKIAETLKAVYGIDVKDVLDGHRSYIGSSSIDVEFSDVFSTAETPQGSLGEYAGKAMGFGQNGSFNVDCPVHGYIICFDTIIPRTQFVDGVNPTLFHTLYTDYYNSKFDGLTLLPTSSLSIYGHDTVCSYSNGDSNADSHSFGNAPIYAEYKTATQGILNGDMSLKSTQNSYDSFTMDKVIANEPIQVDEVADDSYAVTVVEGFPANMTAATSWRYIGRWLWYGRFDRIFVNNRDIPFDSFDVVLDGFSVRRSERTDDNLIVHNIIDLKLNSSMLPLADSYLTKDLWELQNTVGVRTQSE